MVLAVAYAFAFGTSWRRPAGRVLVFLAVPLLAIMCDVIRIVPTLAYYHRNAEAAEDRYHVFVTVWLLVPVAFLMLWVIKAVARWVASPDPDGS